MSIQLKWVPGGGTVTAQRALRIAKVNGSVPNLSTDFTPSNNMDPTVSETLFDSPVDYTIYRLKVQSICETDTVDNTNGVIEGICLPCLQSGVTTTPGQTTIAISIALPNPTPVDGGATIANYSDIDGILFELYDSLGTTKLAGPFTALKSGNPYTSSYTFTGLVSQTDYIIGYRFLVTLNGTQYAIPTTDGAPICFTDTITTTI